MKQSIREAFLIVPVWLHHTPIVKKWYSYAFAYIVHYGLIDLSYVMCKLIQVKNDEEVLMVLWPAILLNVMKKMDARSIPTVCIQHSISHDISREQKCEAIVQTYTTYKYTGGIFFPLVGCVVCQLTKKSIPPAKNELGIEEWLFLF
jgi:hypothetical protein